VRAFSCERQGRAAGSSVIKVPALKAAIPVSIVYRRNGYLGAAARALLATIAGGVRRTMEVGVDAGHA
jgi:hypothetical protein